MKINYDIPFKHVCVTARVFSVTAERRDLQRLRELGWGEDKGGGSIDSGQVSMWAGGQGRQGGECLLVKWACRLDDDGE